MLTLVFDFFFVSQRKILDPEGKPRNISTNEMQGARQSHYERARAAESEAAREELARAAKVINKTETDLAAELLRGALCSLSKADRQRAIGLALKDKKASSSYSQRGSARKLMLKVTTKLQNWASTSTKSLLCSTEEDDDDK